MRRVRSTEAAIQLRRNDFLHVLGDTLDDEIDDALLVPANAVTLGPGLMILDDATNLLGDEAHDGIDDSLLIEIIVAATAVALVPAAIASLPIARSALIVPPRAAIVVA
jgi:hypothetical protein